MINRIEDKTTIEKVYAESLGKAVILILFSKSGIGKSYLVDNIFTDRQESSYIRCRINQQEAEETKGLYISCLAKALNKYAHKTSDFLSLEEFIENLYSLDIDREKVVNDLLDVAADLAKLKIVKEKLDQNKNFKEDLVKKILQNDNDISLSLLIEYIIFITANKRLVVSIENIQNANKNFISFITELLNRSKNLFLVGEYTITDTEEEIAELFKQLPIAHTEVFELKKMPKEELLGGVRQIAQQETVNEICAVIENSYDDSFGNLIKFELLLKKNRHQWNLIGNKGLYSIKYDDTIHSVYSSLSNDEKMTLWYIVTHLGKVHTFVLKKFAGQGIWDRVGDIETIKIKGLLNERDGFICIQHDSIVELLKQEEDFRKFSLIANNEWLTFYRRITISNEFEMFSIIDVTKQDIFILQLTFILNIGGTGNIDWMNTILKEINDSITSTFSNSLINKITNLFYQVVETSANTNLVLKTYEWIIIILSKLGFSGEIVNVLKKYSPQTSSELVTLLQFSARIASCDTSVKNELEVIDQTKSPFLAIGSQILRIRYYRTFNQIKKARSIWESLLKSESAKKTPYHEIILDQVNLCSFNFSKRQKLLDISQAGHLNSGMKYQFCSALLNINANSYYLYLMRLLSKQRYLDITSQNLERVKGMLSETHYPMHAYLNQKAIHQLASRNINNITILNNFKTAYLSCGIPGNKPLIGSNIIAVALKENDISGVQGYVEDLMENSRKFSELNSEFAKYPLINCYNYYVKAGDRAGQKETLRLLKKGKAFNSTMDYWTIIPALNELILRSIKYYPSNIFNWDIDFESIQQKY